MAKKSTRAAKPRNPTTPRDIERWLEQAGRCMVTADYPGILAAARRVLHAPIASSEQRVEALAHIGGAYMMQEQFDRAYAALSEALTLKSDDAMLWFNHGMTARYTMRLVESLRDMERAAELDTDHILDPKLADALAFARTAAESERALRGPNFTFDQLAAQEELFQKAGDQMGRGNWPEAEALFRAVIAVADVLPQPWGNLGICLMMQRKFDEAEDALRRALEIEPKYTIARQNLAGMPAIRASGVLPQIGITHPLRGSKQHLSVLIEGEKKLRDVR